MASNQSPEKTGLSAAKNNPQRRAATNPKRSAITQSGIRTVRERPVPQRSTSVSAVSKRSAENSVSQKTVDSKKNALSQKTTAAQKTAVSNRNTVPVNTAASQKHVLPQKTTATQNKTAVSKKPESTETAASQAAAAAQKTTVSKGKAAPENRAHVLPEKTTVTQNKATTSKKAAPQKTTEGRPVDLTQAAVSAETANQRQRTPLPGMRAGYSAKKPADHRAIQNKKSASEQTAHEKQEASASSKPKTALAQKTVSDEKQAPNRQTPLQSKPTEGAKKTSKLKSKAEFKDQKNTGKPGGSKRSPIAALKNYMAHWSEYSTKKKTLSILIAAVAALLIIFILFSIFELITTPELNLDNFNYIQGTQILDKNGNAYQNLESSEYREIVSIDQVPEHVKNAFIDIEDQRFYSHSGVDFRGLMRAILTAFSTGSLDGPGGSTITQQLIKQTHLSSEKTISRKYHEFVLALQLENVYTKDQILEAYLNKINLSQAWGIQSAAKTYFNVDVSNLSLAQAAILAAVPKSPDTYDPYIYNEDGSIARDANGQCILSEANQERAIIILDKMLELNHITQTERDQAVTQIQNNTVGLTYVAHTNVYSYFTEALYSELIDDLVAQKNMTEEQASEYLLTGGLIIYSTVDQEVQTAMETSAADDSLFPDQSNAAAAASEALSADTGETVNYTPEVAMTVIDNATGSVAGMVGGRTKDSNLTLNRATRRFQPGSSTKPLTTYGPGIDTGAITLATLYDDVDISYYGWQPKNSGGGHSGRITVRQGIVSSLNTIAAQACIATGIETCASYAEKVGLYINRENGLDVNAAALALGGYSEGQTTLAMASAYSSFANGGVHKSYSFYTKVTDQSGNIILQEETTETQVYSPQTAYLITDVLQQAVHGGTTTISCDQPVAGKTGTTDDEVHAWICGYTPYYSMAVWYGYDENVVETSQGTFNLSIDLTGGSKPGPASMFQAVMQAINNNKDAASFSANPGGITTATIDTISGKLATDLSATAGHTRTEMFIDGTAPTTSDDSHYTAKICTVSGKLAGAYCPASTVTTNVFYRTSSLFPAGITGIPLASNLAPTDTCTVHTKTVTTSPTTTNDDTTNNNTTTDLLRELFGD